jgi:hypothetical protein
MFGVFRERTDRGGQVRRRPFALVLSCLAVVTVGAFAVVGCASDHSTTTLESTPTTVEANGPGTTASGKVSSTKPTVGPPATAKAGQQAQVAEWKITVDSVQRKADVDGVKAAAGDEMLVVTFTVQNTSSRPVALTREDFSLLGGSKQTYAPVDTKKGLFSLPPVAANGQASTYLVFIHGSRLIGRGATRQARARRLPESLCPTGRVARTLGGGRGFHQRPPGCVSGWAGFDRHPQSGFSAVGGGPGSRRRHACVDRRTDPGCREGFGLRVNSQRMGSKGGCRW